MPSPRISTFIGERAPSVIEAELVPTGRHTRDLPPASAELTAPAGVEDRADKRRRHAHPAKVGRPSSAEQVQAVNTVFDCMKREMDIESTAAAAGLGQDGRKVREIMTSAKEAMQRRVGEYVEVHMVAAKVAALKGDAKPAEWALENISVEGERVVDPPQKHTAPVAPVFNLGFVVGGMPQQARQLPPAKE